MIRLILLVVAAALAVAGSASALEPRDRPAIVPSDSPITLLGENDLTGLYTFLEDTQYDDPRHVFSIRDGLLTISGDGYGGLSTRDNYADYYLVCEFKWGRKTWGARKTRARDSGILVHGTGPDGAFYGRWMKSIEVQIIEGGLGDVLVLNGDRAEDSARRAVVTTEIKTDRDGEAVWKPGGVRHTIHEGRINWSGRDEDWEDTLGFHGSQDIGDPHDEWTRMEVICDGSTLRVFVNGILVDEVIEISPHSGKITLQAEGAEILVRRWELWPLQKQPTDSER
jgi:hypothetical protein